MHDYETMRIELAKLGHKQPSQRNANRVFKVLKDWREVFDYFLCPAIYRCMIDSGKEQKKGLAN